MKVIKVFFFLDKKVDKHTHLQKKMNIIIQGLLEN